MNRICPKKEMKQMKDRARERENTVNAFGKKKCFFYILWK